jgi:hypothetical protein
MRTWTAEGLQAVMSFANLPQNVSMTIARTWLLGAPSPSSCCFVRHVLFLSSRPLISRFCTFLYSLFYPPKELNLININNSPHSVMTSVLFVIGQLNRQGFSRRSRVVPRTEVAGDYFVRICASELLPPRRRHTQTNFKMRSQVLRAGQAANYRVGHSYTQYKS